MSDGPYRVLPLEVQAVRDASYLRLGGAIVCVVMAAWLAMIQPSWRIGIFAALGVIVAAFWVRSFLMSRRRLNDGQTRQLALEPGQLQLHDGGDEPLTIAWEAVRGVDVDEDRLEVRVHHPGGPLYIEPVYGGLGVYELEELVRAAFEASRGDAGAPPSGGV